MGITMTATRAFRETGASFFFIPKGALTHHLPAGQVVVAFPVVRPYARLRAKSLATLGCAPTRLAAARRPRRMRLLWEPPANAAETAIPVIIVCAEGSVRRPLRLRKPAPGSFVAEAGTVISDLSGFLFCERETEKRLDELAMAQLAIRPQKEASAESRVQAAYGDKYDFWTMIGAKCEVAEMLDEEEPRSIRERLRRKEIEKQRAERQGTPRTQKNKDRGWER